MIEETRSGLGLHVLAVTEEQQTAVFKVMATRKRSW